MNDYDYWLEKSKNRKTDSVTLGKRRERELNRKIKEGKVTHPHLRDIVLPEQYQYLYFPTGDANQKAKRLGLPDRLTSAEVYMRFAYYGFRCIYCGADRPGLDHRIPFCRGGRNIPSNVIPCCHSCNSKKGKRTETEYRRVRD